MMQGYPSQPTVHPGEALQLHVSTHAPAFRVEFYRQGATLAFVGASDLRRGRHHPPGNHRQAWMWSSEAFDIPPGWPPGVYLALLIEVDAQGADLERPAAVFDGRDSRALFVLRPRAAANRILYKLAWATYHAYNASGGGSMYVGDGWLPATAAVRLTTQRPGGGTGGALSFPGDVDVYDPATPREGFAHWDAPFVAWLESNGYAVDFCTDLDLERDPALIGDYRLLLSVGHDEYWSGPVRDAVETFVAAGGNVAFFGGNTCWWRVAFERNGEGMSCLHPPLSLEPSDHWWRTRPENTLTGVSYRNGGGWWAEARDPLGFTVQHAGHWIYEGTGLRDGDTFGAQARLVGYECDGASLAILPGGLRVADGADGTPGDFVVLGYAPLSERWQDRARGANAAATLGVHAPYGTVFTCGTTDWSRLLAGADATVARITRNVLDRLSSIALCIEPAWPDPSDTGASVIHAAGGAGAGARTSYRAFAKAGSALDLPPTDLHWQLAVDGVVIESTPRVDGSIVIDMPPGPAMVTVSVAADTVAGPAFGALTRRALSPQETLQARLLIDLRDLVQATAPALAPGLDAGPGNRDFGAPQWDPLRDGLRAPISPRAAAKAMDLAERIRTHATMLAP